MPTAAELDREAATCAGGGYTQQILLARAKQLRKREQMSDEDPRATMETTIGELRGTESTDLVKVEQIDRSTLRQLARGVLAQDKALQEYSEDAGRYRELARTSRELYIAEAAKTLRMRDPETRQVIGQNTLFRILLREGILFKTTNRRVKVYEVRQRYVGYFVRRPRQVNRLGQSTWTILVTIEGLSFLRRMLKRQGYEPIN